MKRFLGLWLSLLLLIFFWPPPHALPFSKALRLEKKTQTWLYAWDDAEHNTRLRQRFRYGCDAHYPRATVISLPETVLFYFETGGKRFAVHLFNPISQRYPISDGQRVYFCRAELINAFYLLMD